MSQTVRAQNSSQFGERVDLGLVGHPELVEASGLVASRENSHVYWSHNDRDHENRLFALNTLGTNLGEYCIAGVTNRDWEDMAVGPGPFEGVEYLYIGEIGDNDSVHDLKYVYRVPEPNVAFNQAPVETTLAGVDTITFQYPDGNRDAETLMLDPLTRDIYVVSKREFEDIRVYRAPYPQSTSTTIILEHVATLTLSQIVGGDISASGLEILMKTYTTMYYWSRTETQNLWEAFDVDPVEVPYVEETQGEAVCWAANGIGYCTVSEELGGVEAHLYFYPRINPGLATINEIMQNPSAVDDGQGEWFEICNTGTTSVDLYSWELRDSGFDSHVISEHLTLSPGEYLVFGNNADQNSNGGVVVDYEYDSFVLDNTDDEILLVSPIGQPGGTIIDSVEYDNGTTFPNKNGASMALLDPKMDNSVGFHWRDGTTPFGDGDLGTPGSPNQAPIPVLPIRAIQYITDLSGSSPLLGQDVTISGIATTDPFGFGGTYFFVQDSIGMWSGIMINYTSGVGRGDSVTLTGTVAERYENTIIMGVSSFSILVESVPGIQPIQVTTGEIATAGEHSEAYEGVLINAVGACDNENMGYCEWSIDDGSGSSRIYHTLHPSFDPILGNTYDVTGIQYYSYDNFKILTRDETDILFQARSPHVMTLKPVTLRRVFPTPARTFTTISYRLLESCTHDLSVYDTAGRLVERLFDDHVADGSRTVHWNVGETSSGTYFIRLTSTYGTETRCCVVIE